MTIDFGGTSQCRGSWLYFHYKSCLDPERPIHPVVVDAEICGVSTEQNLVRVHEFSMCEHPAHGIDRYAEEQVVEKWSGWRKGGYNRSAWCSDVQREFEAALGEPVIWKKIEHNERSEERFVRRFYYKYYCKLTASWNPIYKKERTNACPPAPHELVTVSTPNQCQDRSRITGYETHARPDCGEEAELSVEAGTKANDLYPLVKEGKITEPICSTCDDLVKNSNAYAECLIKTSEDLAKHVKLWPLGEVHRQMVELFRRSSNLTRSNKLLLEGQVEKIAPYL